MRHFTLDEIERAIAKLQRRIPEVEMLDPQRAAVPGASDREILASNVRETIREAFGAVIMRTVFSKNDPVLAVNDLKDQTDLDEQEGMMHLLEGAVLVVRNLGRD